MTHVQKLNDAGDALEQDYKAREGLNYYRNVRHDLISVVPPDARKVLDFGCGEGVTGLALREARPGCRVDGVEIQPEAARKALENLDEVYCCTPGNEELLPGAWRDFDGVIFGDVLEHLVDPWSTLQEVIGHIRPGGWLITNIPNIRHHSVVWPLIKGRWDYKAWGILDQTHLRFFTHATMREMLEGAGLVIEHEEPQVKPGFKSRRKRERWIRINRMLGGRLTQFLTVKWLFRCRVPEPN
jgi:2-polyprenyl-3-methyl-5-hydroxy-6-metoxy-1,4-benzoquinol methylase